MAAFSASKKAVDEAYAAAISAGAEDEGAPGLRPNFGPNYYGAYFRDLDGNKIHFVCREEEATEAASSNRCTTVRRMLADPLSRSNILVCA
jgi:predicted lactoylglutathione lyase